MQRQPDPMLWSYVDHRRRADELIAQGKPLSIHFDGEMYVHGELVHIPVWIGDTYVWTVKPMLFGEDEYHIKIWRRRKDAV